MSTSIKVNKDVTAYFYNNEELDKTRSIAISENTFISWKDILFFNEKSLEKRNDYNIFSPEEFVALHGFSFCSMSIDSFRFYSDFSKQKKTRSISCITLLNLSFFEKMKIKKQDSFNAIKCRSSDNSRYYNITYSFNYDEVVKIINDANRHNYNYVLFVIKHNYLDRKKRVDKIITKYLRKKDVNYKTGTKWFLRRIIFFRK